MQRKAFTVIALMAILLLTTSLPTSVHAAEPTLTAAQSLVPLGCEVWAEAPFKSASTIRGRGAIACLTPQVKLQVVVGLESSTGQYITQVKTCYQTDYCSAVAVAPYTPGRQWLADVTAYIGTSWYGYAASTWVYIP